jgi:hypothetical protein
MSWQAHCRSDWRVVGRGVQVGRQNLSRCSGSAPADPAERECDPIPPPDGLRVELRDESAQDVIVDDPREVPHRRADRLDEVRKASSVEQRLRSRSRRGLEDAIHVDEPLTGLHGRRSRSDGADE